MIFLGFVFLFGRGRSLASVCSFPLAGVRSCSQGNEVNGTANQEMIKVENVTTKKDNSQKYWEKI